MDIKRQRSRLLAEMNNKWKRKYRNYKRFMHDDFLEEAELKYFDKLYRQASVKED